MFFIKIINPNKINEIMSRRRNNLLASCKGECLISFQSSEEVNENKRRTTFFRSNIQTAELYKFATGVKKEIREYKLSKQN